MLQSLRLLPKIIFCLGSLCLIYGRDTAVKGLQWEVDKQRKLDNILVADTRSDLVLCCFLNDTFLVCEQEVVCTVHQQFLTLGI